VWARLLLPPVILLSLLSSPPLAGESFARGQLIENVACQRDPSQTYTLYLPSRYDPQRRWPALLVFDPRGRGTFAAKIFEEAAERFGWIILSSNNTQSDGPMEPNLKALNAMWPEVHLVFATDPARIYAAGFSGGGIVAWMLSQETHQLAGIIASGGLLPKGIPTDRIEAAHFGSAGKRDFNFLEMHRIDELLERKDVPHRLEVFDGRHQWLPPWMAADALGWMELVAMRRELRPKDDALIETLYAREWQRAGEEGKSGGELASLRRYEMIARTFRGLHDLSEVEKKIEALKGLKAVRVARRNEVDWDGFERRQEANLSVVVQQLDDPEPPMSPEILARALSLRALQKRAESGGYKGESAQRALEEIYVQMSFYLMRDAMQAKSWARAELVLSVASRIHPENPVVWYNLASAQARMGKRDEALDSLDRAVENGFRDARHASEDADLESIRGMERFDGVLKRMAAVATAR